MRDYNWYSPEGRVIEPLKQGKWRDIQEGRMTPELEKAHEELCLRNSIIVSPNSCAVACLMASFNAREYAG